MALDLEQMPLKNEKGFEIGRAGEQQAAAQAPTPAAGSWPEGFP